MTEFIIDTVQWEEKVLQVQGKLVVVEFTASWCGPCRIFEPKFEEIAKEFTDVSFYKVDVDKNMEVAGHEGVSKMPTFKCYRNVEMIEENCEANEDKLRAMITKNK